VGLELVLAKALIALELAVGANLGVIQSHVQTDHRLLVSQKPGVVLSLIVRTILVLVLAVLIINVFVLIVVGEKEVVGTFTGIVSQVVK
jgi:hypothetical protein